MKPNSNTKRRRDLNRRQQDGKVTTMSLQSRNKSGLARTSGRVVVALGSILLAAPLAAAGQASTSASAGSNGHGPGTAAATAEYTGDQGRGYADTRTRSGPVNYARGVAYGIDQNGISFSVSHAVAGRRGPAFASTYNLSIGFDGSISRSRGVSVANGSRSRTAHAGGFSRAGRGRTTAVATAGGRTGRRGYVRANTHTHTKRPRRVWRWRR